VADLRARIDRMEGAVDRGDLDAYHEANLGFHDRLVELAGNAKLLALYRRLVNELSLYRRTALDQTGIPSMSLAEHRAIVKRMRAAGRDPEAYFPLNIEFHEALAEAAGNRALATHYRRVVNELNLYRREAIQRNVDVIPVSTREHAAVVDAVAEGDAALASRLLYDHVINSRSRLQEKDRQAA